MQITSTGHIVIPLAVTERKDTINIIDYPMKVIFVDDKLPAVSNQKNFDKI